MVTDSVLLFVVNWQVTNSILEFPINSLFLSGYGPSLPEESSGLDQGTRGNHETLGRSQDRRSQSDKVITSSLDKKIELEGVIVSSKLNGNFLSVSQFDKAGYRIEIFGGKMRFLRNGTELVLIAELDEDDLYEVKLKKAKCNVLQFVETAYEPVSPDDQQEQQPAGEPVEEQADRDQQGDGQQRTITSEQQQHGDEQNVLGQQQVSSEQQSNKSKFARLLANRPEPGSELKITRSQRAQLREKFPDLETTWVRPVNTPGKQPGAGIYRVNAVVVPKSVK